MNDAAAPANAAAGLPTLVGTEKQVVWAEKLRKGVLDEVEVTVATLAATQTGHDAPWPVCVYPEFVSWLRDQDSAAYWIQNRGVRITESDTLTEAENHFTLWLETERSEDLAAYEATLRDRDASEEARRGESELSPIKSVLEG